MAEFDAGLTLIACTVYLFLAFLICFSAIKGAGEMGMSHQYSVSSNNIVTASGNTNESLYSGASSADTISMGGMVQTMNFMTGFGWNSLNVGVPSSIGWIFRIVLFYLPVILWGISLYFSLPFI